MSPRPDKPEDAAPTADKADKTVGRLEDQLSFKSRRLS